MCIYLKSVEKTILVFFRLKIFLLSELKWPGFCVSLDNNSVEAKELKKIQCISYSDISACVTGCHQLSHVAVVKNYTFEETIPGPSDSLSHTNAFLYK